MSAATRAATPPAPPPPAADPLRASAPPAAAAAARALPPAAATYSVVGAPPAGSGGPAVDLDAVAARLGAALADGGDGLRLARAGRERWRWRFVDTFDGRLHRAGSTLAAVTGDPRRPAATRGTRAAPSADAPEGWLLWHAADGQLRHAAPWPGDPPAFASDVAAPAFHAELAALADPRRLLRLVDVHASVRRYAVVDGDGKTVARLRLGDGTARLPRGASLAARPSTAEDAPARAALPPWLDVVGVRGYDAARARVEAACAALAADGVLAPARGSLAARALAALGRPAGGQSGKFDVAIRPDQRADDAAGQIFQVLLEAIRTNEAGTRADLDPEFLHDFRVAVRRTRAGLTLLRDALPPAVVEHFKAEFGWLGGATGPTRDLDVYLETMPAYRAALPPDVAADLGPLEDHLRARQAAAHAALVTDLDSPRYAALVADWAAALARLRAEGAEAPAAAEPIAALAARRTWQRFKRLLDDGRQIDGETEVAALHALRIEAKKLRYALEFFRRLVPPAEADALIGSLKDLQDNLGQLNDTGVQQGAMRGFAAEIGRRPSCAGTVLAMGWLMAELHAREQACRHDFAARFAAFEARDNRERYARLFKAGRSGR